MVEEPTLEQLLEELTRAADGVRVWAESRSKDATEGEHLWHRFLMAEEHLHERVMDLAGEDSD
jgi:hypothetical protein